MRGDSGCFGKLAAVEAPLHFTSMITLEDTFTSTTKLNLAMFLQIGYPFANIDQGPYL